MATLIQSYEQQYSVLTADITAKIVQLKVGKEENREHLSKEIQSNFEEANDLLEQLNLECRGGGVSSRAAAYRAELNRIRDEYRSVLATSNHLVDTEEVYDDWNCGNEQKRKLLNSSETKEFPEKTFSEICREVIQEEHVTMAMLHDLNDQPEPIQRGKAQLLDTNDKLNRSTHIVTGMATRSPDIRLVLMLLSLIIGLVTCASFYMYLT